MPNSCGESHVSLAVQLVFTCVNWSVCYVRQWCVMIGVIIFFLCSL